MEIIQGKPPGKRLLRRLFGAPNPRWPDCFQIEVEDEAERANRIVRGEAALVVLRGNVTVFFVGLCGGAILEKGESAASTFSMGRELAYGRLADLSAGPAPGAGRMGASRAPGRPESSAKAIGNVLPRGCVVPEPRGGENV